MGSDLGREVFEGLARGVGKAAMAWSMALCVASVLWLTCQCERSAQEGDTERARLQRGARSMRAIRTEHARERDSLTSLKNATDEQEKALAIAEKRTARGARVQSLPVWRRSAIMHELCPANPTKEPPHEDDVSSIDSIRITCPYLDFVVESAASASEKEKLEATAATLRKRRHAFGAQA